MTFQTLLFVLITWLFSVTPSNVELYWQAGDDISIELSEAILVETRFFVSIPRTSQNLKSVYDNCKVCDWRWTKHDNVNDWYIENCVGFYG